MTRDQIKAAIDGFENTIRNGLAWDAKNSHVVYRMSSQYKSDKAAVRALKKKLKSTEPAPVHMSVVSGVWDGRVRG